MARMTVGDVVADGLARAGASRVFVTGGVLAGALAGPARAHELDVVAVGAPAAACMMAAIAARLADAPGACALSGAAVVEARAALAHAARDRAPVIIVADDAADAGLDVKARVALDTASAAHWTAHALRLAMADPRGPVQLVTPAPLLLEAAVPEATVVRRPVPSPPDAATLDAAAAALVAASRPAAIAGLGCRRVDAAAWLRPFAEALPVPVIVTPGGRGALPDPHPLMLGVLGSAAAERLIARADLVVTLGVDPIEVDGAPWGTAPVLAVGVGDVGIVLEELAPRLRGSARADWDVAELDRLKRAVAITPAALSAPARIAAIARDAMPPGTVAAADAEYADGVGHAWQVVSPNELLLPAAAGIPGFAVAASVAAKLARPATPVVAFAHAGRQTDTAVETAARLALPVAVLVLGGAGSPAPPGVPIADARTEARLRGALERVLAGGSRGPLVLDARV